MTPIPTNCRSRLRAAAGALALLFVVVVQVPATAAQDPNTFIAKVGTKGLRAVGPEISPAKRLARLRELFHNNFDIAGIGFFALGRYRSIATPQEQQQFFVLYPAFTVRALNARLNEYSGAQFRVTGMRPLDQETLVNSEITRTDGSRVQLDWYLTNSDGHYQIIDVAVGGVSMKIALRDQFASWIQGNGGRFDALLAVLRQETGAVRAR